MGEPQRLSRRALLGGFAGAAALGLGACSSSTETSSATGPSTPARPRSAPAGPGTLPNPGAAAGTDQLPLLSNIVIVMLENHSYDNVLGMQRDRGDGFTLAKDGKPTATNPWPASSSVPPPGGDSLLRAFPMPNPCQPDGHPFNTWDAFWASYADGRLDGFAASQSGPVSMGYLEPSVLPFTNSLAAT